MIERAEINNDLTRDEPVREVRYTKETRTGETTQKEFVAELERRKHKKKKKGESEKDRIVLHEDDGEAPKGEMIGQDDENERKAKNENRPAPSPNGSKGKRVDVLA